MRYPIERTEYCMIVGETRVKNIVRAIRSLGLEVKINKPQAHDVDIWVYNDGTLVLVIEVINWKKKSYMDLKRAKSINKNFSGYTNVRHLLISSFKKNYILQKRFISKGINLDYLNVGFQTQPIHFFQFYNSKGLANDMRPDTPVTRSLVRTKIKTYLKRIGLI